MGNRSRRVAISRETRAMCGCQEIDGYEETQHDPPHPLVWSVGVGCVWLWVNVGDAREVERKIKIFS
jgi:hypothetical protein